MGASWEACRSEFKTSVNSGRLIEKFSQKFDWQKGFPNGNKNQSLIKIPEEESLTPLLEGHCSFFRRTYRSEFNAWDSIPSIAQKKTRIVYPIQLAETIFKSSSGIGPKIPRLHLLIALPELSCFYIISSSFLSLAV